MARAHPFFIQKETLRVKCVLMCACHCVKTCNTVALCNIPHNQGWYVACGGGGVHLCWAQKESSAEQMWADLRHNIYIRMYINHLTSLICLDIFNHSLLLIRFIVRLLSDLLSLLSDLLSANKGQIRPERSLFVCLPDLLSALQGRSGREGACPVNVQKHS